MNPAQPMIIRSGCRTAGVSGDTPHVHQGGGPVSCGELPGLLALLAADLILPAVLGIAPVPCR